MLEQHPKLAPVLTLSWNQVVCIALLAARIIAAHLGRQSACARHACTGLRPGSSRSGGRMTH